MDYELDFDRPCPKCGHEPTHYRPCGAFCHDGFFDCYDEDPVNFGEGEEWEVCLDCHGTGLEAWCPKCGFDLQDPQNNVPYGDHPPEWPESRLNGPTSDFAAENV